MYKEGKIWFGMSGDEKLYFDTKMANRHGLIAGATGTGKTTTLRTLAESFSDCGVPVFLSDMKGDLAAMCRPGNAEGFVGKRIEEYGLDAEGFAFHGCPVAFWDIYAEKGMPLRATVSEMGPVLLAKILGLNATQEAVLTVAFKAADDEGLLLIDTKDLKAFLNYVGETADVFAMKYGNVSKQSLAAIIRAIVALESEGGEQFFGEPALNITDWIKTDFNGKGVINILDCQRLIHNPNMYGTFMLWMISELYETLPEVGDQERPRMVFFFDEAHLLFDNAKGELLAKLEQVVKLIRSKGVGIYFITQSPKDIPGGILAQLNNKIQHGLRAYTPAEQKAVKAAAESFRINPEFDTYETLINLGIGEAVVSVLDEGGVPTIAKKGIILPPQCSLDVLDDASRAEIINSSELYLKYKDYYDRDSAYEFLQRKGVADNEAAQRQRALAEEEKEASRQAAAQQKAAEKEAAAASAQKKRLFKNVAGTAGSTIGRELGNTLGSSIGGSFGKRLGGNLGSSLGRGILGTLFGK